PFLSVRIRLQKGRGVSLEGRRGFVASFVVVCVSGPSCGACFRAACVAGWVTCCGVGDGPVFFGGGGVGVSGAGGEVQGAVLVLGDGAAAVVFGFVLGFAVRGEVFGHCFAAVFPSDGVVDLALVGGDGAAEAAAVPVA